MAFNFHLRRSAEAADQLVDQLQQTHGVSVLGLEADVGCEADVVRMFDTVQQRLGLPTVLVNNAAICPTCQVVDTGLSQWDETLRVNLTGTFLTCREFVARLTAKDVADSSAEVQIVNVSSTAAFLGSTTGHAPYDASKGAWLSFTISLAREVAGVASP